MTQAENDRCDKVLRLIDQKLKTHVLSSINNLGTPEVRISSDKFTEFFKLLKLDSELSFNVFLSVTATDWLDDKDERFELVYHLLSTTRLHRIRIKISLPENALKIPSLVPLWKGANYMEREVFDMYGVEFVDHPDLRRILMYDEFVGYPLRKDYPVQGKQPRVPLRSPEVENTARLMERPPLAEALVQIGGSTGKSAKESAKEIAS